MSESRPFSIISAIAVAAALVIGAILVANSISRRTTAEDTIRVDGSARRIVRSDYIIWTAQVAYQAPTVSAAYSSVQDGVTKLRTYLVSKGLKDAEIFPLAIKTEVLYAKTPGNGGGDESVYRKIEAYKLSQDVEVRSNQVNLVEGLSRTATDLINQGVSLQSMPPQYRITNLADLKDSILAEAAKNARTRAQHIATSSGAVLGPLKHANMGVMQVTGAYEDEQQGGGEDTQSLDKKVTVMITSAYTIR